MVIVKYMANYMENDISLFTLLVQSNTHIDIDIHIHLSLTRFAAITLNLGPTFLSGTMAANVNHRPREPSCPLVQVVDR